MRGFCIILVTLTTVDFVSAAGPNNVIRSGTHIALGQYCTAVRGSMQNCASLASDFKAECEAVRGMVFVDGNRDGRGPQMRCLAAQ